MLDPCIPRREEISIPEVGACFVRGLTLRERGAVSSAIDESGSQYDPILALVAIMVVDANGDQIWDASSWDIFCGKYGGAASDLFDVVTRLAGLDEDTAKKD